MEYPEKVFEQFQDSLKILENRRQSLWYYLLTCAEILNCHVFVLSLISKNLKNGCSIFKRIVLGQSSSGLYCWRYCRFIPLLRLL